MNLAKTDHAVSPVIATILLVAIAVALSAIILAVTMGFSGDPNEKNVGLSAKSAEGPNATLLLYGGDSIPELVELDMIDQDSPYGEYVEVWNKSSGTAAVGIPYEADYVAQPTEDMETYDTKINVKGIFSDGKESILLVQPMTFHDVFASEKAPSVPTVSVPKVSQIGVTTAFAEAEYKGMTSVPTYWAIRFQSLDVEGQPISRVSNYYHLTNTSGIISGNAYNFGIPDDLSSGRQAFWAEVTTPTDGTVVSEKTIINTLATSVGTPYLTVIDGRYVVRADFKNMGSRGYQRAELTYSPSGRTGWGSTINLVEIVGEKDPSGNYYTEGYIYLPIGSPDVNDHLGTPVSFRVEFGGYSGLKGEAATIQLPPTSIP